MDSTDQELKIHTSECRKKVFAFVVLLIIILLSYSNTFNASWHFDDEPNILDRKALHLTELSWSNIKQTFFQGTKLYRPISCFSFGANYFFGETNVFGYHLVNIIIHFLSSFFLYIFIYQTLHLPSVSKKYRQHSYFISLLAAILWASNPANTQAVTYIVQRMASMAGMFYITTMFFFLKGRTSKKNKLKGLYFTICIFTALLSFGSKENTIVLPISLLMYEILLINGTTFRGWIIKNKIFLITAIFFVLAVTVFYITMINSNPISFMGAYDKYRVFSLKERLLTEPRIIIFYITLLLYPDPNRLSLSHDIHFSQSLFNPLTTVFSILLIATLIIVAFAISKKHPLLSFSILFFFLNHIVESTFLPLELIYEHRNYIPSMFLFIPFVIFLLFLLEYFSNKLLIRSLLIVSAVLFIVSQGHATYIRNFAWKTEESIWFDGIEKYPDFWRPYLNLGSFYMKKNMPEKALDLFRQAEFKRHSVNSGDKHLTYFNIGVAYQKMGENEKAFQYYLKAEKIYSIYSNTHVNKAVILTEKGYFEDAHIELKKAIQCDRNNPQAYINFGILLLKKGQIKEAIDKLEIAKRLAPNDILTLKSLGYAYLKLSQYGKATALFTRVKDLTPYDSNILLFLSEIYSIKGMTSQAKVTINEMIKMTGFKNLERYVKELGENNISSQTIAPNRLIILGLLAEVLNERSTTYQELAKYCHEKKSELAKNASSLEFINPD